MRTKETDTTGAVDDVAQFISLDVRHILPAARSSSRCGDADRFRRIVEGPRLHSRLSNVVETEPILLTGEEAQDIVAALGSVKPEIKAFLVDYSNRLIK